MSDEFPSAVPEIPVSSIDEAAAYYVNNLGFILEWGDEESGIAGIAKDHCRMFLTNTRFRETYRNVGPVMIWLNLNSKDEVDDLYERWKSSNAKLLSAAESKSWNLHEFTAADLDGNLIRVFYDLGSEARLAETVS